MKFKYNLKQKINNRNHASTKNINHTRTHYVEIIVIERDYNKLENAML